MVPWRFRSCCCGCCWGSPLCVESSVRGLWGESNPPSSLRPLTSILCPPLLQTEHPLRVGIDDLQDSDRAAPERKGWEEVSKAWVRGAGLEPPTPPVGSLPADGHGQWGLRWGLLEQLLELQQLLLLELLELLLLLLVEHSGCGKGRSQAGSPSPSPSPRSSHAADRVSRLPSRSCPERATRAPHPFHTPPIPPAAEFNHPPANFPHIFPIVPPPNAQAHPPSLRLPPLRSSRTSVRQKYTSHPTLQPFSAPIT